MEWTGARYADKPTVQVEIFVKAPAAQVWKIVSDVKLMPTMSTELQAVDWLDGATGPGVGARFVGRSKHDALGDWDTISTVVECVEPDVFAWAVGDPELPTAVWRFNLRAKDGGTVLGEWMQMGPGRSGLSFAIERMPEKEQKIVFVRMREFEANITATLTAIKERAEGARTGDT